MLDDPELYDTARAYLEKRAAQHEKQQQKRRG